MPIPIQTRRQAVRRFVLRFVCSCLVLFSLANCVPASWKGPINTLTAKLLAAALGIFGLTVSVKGVMVSAGEFSVRIITECTAIFVVILFFAFVFSYPASWRDKAIGLALGVPALFSFNLFRLLVVFYTGIKQPRFFDFVHVYLGQLAMVLVVLLACMVWLRTIAAVPMSDSPLSFLVRFISWSSVFFILWLFLYEDYVMALFQIIEPFLNAAEYKYSVVKEKIDLNPTAFNTLNMVTYAALVLATRSLRDKKPLHLIVGLTVLSLIHLLFGLFRVLFLGFGERLAVIPFFALIAINELILPFVLWLTVVGKEIFFGVGIDACPICGKPVKGLEHHIEAKHGKRVLKNKKVLALREN